MIEERTLQEQSTIEWLPISELNIDMAYQRNLSDSKVKALCKNFDADVAGSILVNIRDDGQMFVIDGQHRLEAMKRIGKLLVECRVCKGLTQQQESVKYLDANTLVKIPESLDRFRARIICKEAVPLAIIRIVEKCGLRILFAYGKRNGQRPSNSIWAVQALEDIYKHGKEELLEEILMIASRSWPDQSEAFEAKVLLGLLNFHLKYKGKYSREEFIQRMNNAALRKIRQQAQYHYENLGNASIHKGFTIAFQEIYDKGRRTRRLENK